MIAISNNYDRHYVLIELFRLTPIETVSFRHFDVNIKFDMKNVTFH